MRRKEIGHRAGMRLPVAWTMMLAWLHSDCGLDQRHPHWPCIAKQPLQDCAQVRRVQILICFDRRRVVCEDNAQLRAVEHRQKRGACRRIEAV